MASQDTEEEATASQHTESIQAIKSAMVRRRPKQSVHDEREGGGGGRGCRFQTKGAALHRSPPPPGEVTWTQASSPPAQVDRKGQVHVVLAVLLPAGPVEGELGVVSTLQGGG